MAVDILAVDARIKRSLLERFFFQDHRNVGDQPHLRGIAPATLSRSQIVLSSISATAIRCRSSWTMTEDGDGALAMNLCRHHQSGSSHSEKVPFCFCIASFTLLKLESPRRH